ncbi:hypothetical protein MG293_000232 [Ovis ammon polii]|uniref:Uncharacterized protein n=1 Tax=Ovis ammon polii TaxID=230172 RepID=A0AAD4YHV5_OVIAM|nr:hypothetical protein MG293_000232 [Ovis ammon polii]
MWLSTVPCKGVSQPWLLRCSYTLGFSLASQLPLCGSEDTPTSSRMPGHHGALSKVPCAIHTNKTIQHGFPILRYFYLLSLCIILLCMRLCFIPTSNGLNVGKFKLIIGSYHIRFSHHVSLKVKVKVAQWCPTLCDPMGYTVLEFSRPEYRTG